MGDRELWDAYRRTTYCVHDDAGTPVFFTLKDPDLKSRVPRKRFAVITAWNPMNQPRSKEENRGRNAELERVLKKTGWKFYPTAGATEDHCEESFTIEGIGREEALALGRDFGQHAILYSENAEPRVYEC